MSVVSTDWQPFGGQVLALADKAAFFAATKFCRRTVVTASTERIDFNHPIKNGDIVEIEARVVFAGRSSMVVKVDIWSENARMDGRVLCTTGHLTMIALDDDGKPIEVPPLKVRNSQEQEEWEDARKIRKSHSKES
ncbi:MAG: acyl-CoA thioesterase [Nitrospira sp.]|nr:acyl-CoA thioesterase [Nitrospira sp.]